jgi:methionyl-tRNA formyltransferase
VLFILLFMPNHSFEFVLLSIYTEVGQQAFGAAVLQRLLDRGENVVAVCGNPTKPGQADDPLISTARNHGLEVYQPNSWKTPAALEKMKSFQADFCLMAYVTKYFPPEVANTPKYGSACFHPSLLPLHRGPSAISWAIAMGRETTGVTIFEPTEGLDGEFCIYILVLVFWSTIYSNCLVPSDDCHL